MIARLKTYLGINLTIPSAAIQNEKIFTKISGGSQNVSLCTDCLVPAADSSSGVNQTQSEL